MKSRNLFAAAMAAIMIGGVVLAPSVALAQDRGRDNSRQRSSRSDGDRNSSRRGDRSSNQYSQRQNSNRSSNQWNQRREDSDRWRDNDDRSSTPWWQRGSNNDRDNRRGDRDDNDWRNRDRNRNDYNWRDPDHDGDNDSRRHSPIIVRRRSYDYYSYGYNDPYYGNRNSYTYGYGNGYGYSNRDDWRAIADAAGLLAVIGLLDHDNTLFFVGAAGALYSLDRYDQDRYSDDRACRLRAEFFSHPYFYRNGRRYDRELVTRHGQDYYRFVCR